MSLATFNEEGPEPELGAGEYLRCNGCGELFTQTSRFLPKEDGPGYVPCPECESGKGFVRFSHAQPETTVAGRWPGAASQGWTPVPNSFHRNARALGLTLADIGLIDALETRRTTAFDAVFVSYSKLAKETGADAKTIERRISKLVEKGLLEKQRRTRADGGNSTCLITRHGLTRALALIDRNMAAGQEATDGLDALLLELAGPQVQNARAPQGKMPQAHGQNARAEEEPLGEEPQEQEPSFGGRDSRNRGLTVINGNAA